MSGTRPSPADRQREPDLRRHAEAGLSFTMAGLEMGLTKGAVAGSAKRLGIKFNGPRAGTRIPKPKAARKPRKRRALPPPAPPLLDLSGFIATTPATRALAALRSNGCRFGIGDTRSPDFRFCCNPAVRGSYCEAHARVVWSQHPAIRQTIEEAA